eukprot:TRINITY_DN56101_c0_g1_i1.p1 TRINITY_DN56101_c0_g1~~TRINITY_DN56101_c0_g1_i1.p1  ORF type:complete len:307 (+),score=27.96 TRINITY_DN56101_c0_g1_i1:147-1067(+)
MSSSFLHGGGDFRGPRISSVSTQPMSDALRSKVSTPASEPDGTRRPPRRPSGRLTPLSQQQPSPDRGLSSAGGRPVAASTTGFVVDRGDARRPPRPYSAGSLAGGREDMPAPSSSAWVTPDDTVDETHRRSSVLQRLRRGGSVHDYERGGGGDEVYSSSGRRPPRQPPAPVAPTNPNGPMVAPIDRPVAAPLPSAASPPASLLSSTPIVIPEALRAESGFRTTAAVNTEYLMSIASRINALQERTSDSNNRGDVPDDPGHDASFAGPGGRRPSSADLDALLLEYACGGKLVGVGTRPASAGAMPRR